MLENPRDEDLRSGLKGTIHVILHKVEDVLRIKYSPFYVGKGEYQLYVKTKKDRLELRDVKLGNSGSGYIEVLEGLAEGEEAVLSDMARFGKSGTLKIKHL